MLNSAMTSMSVYRYRERDEGGDYQNWSRVISKNTDLNSEPKNSDSYFINRPNLTLREILIQLLSMEVVKIITIEKSLKTTK